MYYVNTVIDQSYVRLLGEELAKTDQRRPSMVPVSYLFLPPPHLPGALTVRVLHIVFMFEKDNTRYHVIFNQVTIFLVFIG